MNLFIKCKKTYLQSLHFFTSSQCINKLNLNAFLWKNFHNLKFSHPRVLITKMNSLKKSSLSLKIITRFTNLTLIMICFYSRSKPHRFLWKIIYPTIWLYKNNLMMEMIILPKFCLVMNRMVILLFCSKVSKKIFLWMI